MSTFLLIFSLWAQPAVAADAPSCATPQASALTLFTWLQAEDYEPSKAGACMGVEDVGEAERLAIQLKAVMDGKGLFVQMEELPNTADYTDDEGLENEPVVLHEGLPQVSLEKRGEDWVFSGRTVAAVPGLYEDTFSAVSVWFQDRLPTAFLYPLVGGLQIWQPLYLLLLLALGTILGALVQWFLRVRLASVLNRLGIPLDTAVVRRLRKPLMYLGAALVLWVGVPDMHLGVRSSASLLLVAKVVTSFWLVVIGVRFIDVLSGVARHRAAATEGRMDDQIVPILERAAKMVVAAVGLVFVLQNMGIDVGSLVAGLGIGGLAFALAAKDALANIFGSLTIFTDRPFQVGDAVEMGSVSGVVEEVGLRSTRIRTFHNSLLTIPNAEVAMSHIDNLGNRPYRRTRTTIGVCYGTPPEVLQAFVEGIRAILAANPVTKKDGYEVNFYAFGASSLDILMNFHLEVADWHGEMTERSRIYLEILRLAEEVGVEFAFPSTSVYLESSPEHPVTSEFETDVEALKAKVESFGPGGSRARPGGPRISHGFEASD